MAGGPAAGATFVTTPSWILTVLFLVFLAISLIIEITLHFTTKHLRKRDRNGLLVRLVERGVPGKCHPHASTQAAVESIKSELLILGFISLLLTALTSTIEGTCVDIRTNWWIINTVSGGPCPSCLLDTNGLTVCYLEYNQCPVERPDLPVPPLGRRLTATTPYDWSSGSHAGLSGRHLTASTLTNPLDLVCNNSPSPVRVGTCPEGQEPMLTYTTLEQVHIMLFLLAIIHIITTISLILLAYARTRMWRRWHTKENLYKEEAARAVSLHQSMKTGRFSLRNLSRQRTLKKAASKEGTAQGPNTRAPQTPQTPLGTSAGERSCDSGVDHTPRDSTPSAHVLPADGYPDLEAGVVDGGAHPEGSATSNRKQVNNDDTEDLRDESPFSFSKAPPPDKSPSLQSNGLLRQQTLPSQLRINTGIERKSMLARNASFRDMKAHHLASEIAICFVSQFVTNPIKEHDFQLMTASFVYTHKLSSSFDFVTLYVIVVLLFGGLGGWLASWLNLFFATSLTVLNTQLIYVIRYATRNASVNKLNHKAFWFKRPELLLPWIRLVLFSASFEFSSQIFYVWQFGAGSCYFHNAGFRAYAAWPFWVDSIIALSMLGVLGVLTLPMYALGVQMGSTHRHHLLPATISSELMAWSRRAKKRVKKEVKATGNVVNIAKMHLGMSVRSDSATNGLSNGASSSGDTGIAANTNQTDTRAVRFQDDPADQPDEPDIKGKRDAVVKGGMSVAKAAASVVAVGGLSVAAALVHKDNEHACEAAEAAQHEICAAVEGSQSEAACAQHCVDVEGDTAVASASSFPEAPVPRDPNDRPRPIVEQVMGIAKTSMSLARTSATLGRTSATLARSSVRSAVSGASVNSDDEGGSGKKRAAEGRGGLGRMFRRGNKQGK